ncbi:MAG: chlorhexidine efflux transporter [Paracoccaceae bacterium]
MALRSFGERVRQTLWFEIGGLVLVTPLYVLIFGGSGPASLALTTTIMIAAMLCSPIYNTLFDWADLRLTGRLASDRPQRLRLFHAALHEIALMAATVPILIFMGGHGFWQAILVDFGFSLFYATYAYGFHLIYDLARPVRPNRARA